ncbi:MAG: hypothetical protein GY798_09430 [Hyphomicrobiales bacterium]|nr:hypothetical protein [Hyphomicrobiales bacterium]
MHRLLAGIESVWDKYIPQRSNPRPIIETYIGFGTPAGGDAVMVVPATAGSAGSAPTNSNATGSVRDDSPDEPLPHD